MEDNIVNQKVAQRLLCRLSHRADMEANGREAIAALQTHSQPTIVAMTAAALLEEQQASI